MQNGVLNTTKIIRHVVILILFIVGFSISASAIGTVPSGSVGVKTRFGAVRQNYVNPGVYIKAPFIEDVKIIDIKNQKEEARASAASKDLQTVNSQIAVNYTLREDQVVKLYATVGLDYKVRIIDPIIQEAVKSVTAKFTAEELITKREEVSEEIKHHLVEKLSPQGIEVQNFSIIDFDFSKSFNDAIEAKVTAEQDALAAKNKNEQIKYEAQQAIEKAKGNAESIRIESQALQSNPAILKLREIENQSKAIEKWSGILPNVTGGAVPFINVQ